MLDGGPSCSSGLGDLGKGYGGLSDASQRKLVPLTVAANETAINFLGQRGHWAGSCMLGTKS